MRAISILARVRPNDAVSPTNAVSLKAARNEFEPFQIVVRADADGLKGVNVEASLIALAWAPRS